MINRKVPFGAELTYGTNTYLYEGVGYVRKIKANEDFKKTYI